MGDLGIKKFENPIFNLFCVFINLEVEVASLTTLVHTLTAHTACDSSGMLVNGWLIEDACSVFFSSTLFKQAD